jgi:hypothetical protein
LHPPGGPKSGMIADCLRLWLVGINSAMIPDMAPPAM